MYPLRTYVYEVCISRHSARSYMPEDSFLQFTWKIGLSKVDSKVLVIDAVTNMLRPNTALFKPAIACGI